MNSSKITRRKAIQHILTGISASVLFGACERNRYIRPASDIDLGPVAELLYSRVHRPIKAVLINRNADGWSALSTRCTYDGCDLTFQEPVLLCPCCRSRYTLDGIPYEGVKASRNLPWIEMSYKDGHLYANPGVLKDKNWKFTTPPIEQAIVKLRKRIKDEGLKDEVEIPQILHGKGDGEFGMMFLEDDPNMIHQLEMIK